MTIGRLEWTQLSPDLIEKLRHAYLGTFRGPHGDAPADRRRLRRHRCPRSGCPPPTSCRRRCWPPTSNSPAAPRSVRPGRGVGSRRTGGFGLALQVVTDQSTMLMDSVTVLLHRLGVAYVGDHEPDVSGPPRSGRRIARHRSPSPPTAHADPGRHPWRPGSTSSSPRRWIVRAVAEAAATDPRCARRQPSGRAGLRGDELRAAGSGRRARRRLRGNGSPARIAATSPTCCAGWPTATSCCSATSAARCATAVRRSTKRAGWVCCDCATRSCRSSPTTTICWCSPRPPSRATCATAPIPTSWWCANIPAARRSSTASSGCSRSRR